MTGRPHIDWQEYYASYDFPSLLADGVTWSDTASVNQMGAYLVRLIDVACDDPHLAMPTASKPHGLLALLRTPFEMALRPKTRRCSAASSRRSLQPLTGRPGSHSIRR
jgi:hypothetical protein